MSLQFVFHVLLGVSFGMLGYFLSASLPDIENTGISIAVKLAVSLASGAIGVFIVPIVSKWVRDWSGILARRIAKEVISQLRLPDFRNMRQFPSRIGKTDTKKKEEKAYDNPIVVDTSALIDGRVADVVENGFLYGTLIVPRLVLLELQHIADAANALRRGKGRRGLDILDKIRKSKQVKVVIYKNGEIEGKSTDEKLLTIAKSFKAKIMTTDFNLNKVATVSGIKTLNINELVNSLKTTLLPGEPLTVKVIQAGKEKSQGVGYLEDGTMIVVENGARYSGQEVQTKVMRVLQTAAGRMIFVQTASEEQKQEA